MNRFTTGTGISKTFIGLILLPIAGNTAEHITAMTVAFRGKMDLASTIAIGSSAQVAALILPLVVILVWITGARTMTLVLDVD